MRDVFINGFTTWGVIQLSRKLSWHVQAPDNKISQAESVKFVNFYVLPTENIGRQHQSSISYLNFWKSHFNMNEVFTQEVMAATNFKTNLGELRGLKKMVAISGVGTKSIFEGASHIDIVPSTLDMEPSTLYPRRKDRLVNTCLSVNCSSPPTTFYRA